MTNKAGETASAEEKSVQMAAVGEYGPGGGGQGTGRGMCSKGWEKFEYGHGLSKKRK